MPSPKPGPMPPMKGPMGKPGPWGGGGFFGGSTPMVLTRLHARYDNTSLSDDIVFKAAEAVVGGREFVIGDKGELEKGAQPSGQNNFQARYIIRHPWTGPILCKNPVRGVWGGPPAGVNGSTAPKPATNLASAARNISLPKHLKAGMPEFQVRAAEQVLPAIGGVVPPGEDAGLAVDDATSADDASAVDASFGGGVPAVEPSSRGCGCDVPGKGGGNDLFAFGLGGAALALGAISRLGKSQRSAKSAKKRGQNEEIEKSGK